VVRPGTSVPHATLTSLIAERRTAVGDDAKTPRLVRTIHGYGYSFIGDVAGAAPVRSPHAEAGMCRIIAGDRDIALAPGANIVGRAPDAAVVRDDGRRARPPRRSP